MFKLTVTIAGATSVFKFSTHADALVAQNLHEQISGGYSTINDVVMCGDYEVAASLVSLIKFVKAASDHPVHASKAILCIKTLREVYRSGLKEAKDCYDSI